MPTTQGLSLPGNHEHSYTSLNESEKRYTSERKMWTPWLYLEFTPEPCWKAWSQIHPNQLPTEKSARKNLGQLRTQGANRIAHPEIPKVLMFFSGSFHRKVPWFTDILQNTGLQLTHAEIAFSVPRFTAVTNKQKLPLQLSPYDPTRGTPIKESAEMFRSSLSVVHA